MSYWITYLLVCFSHQMAELSETTPRRLFVGGLFDGITDNDLKERFQRFGSVTSVEVKTKSDKLGMYSEF